MKVKNKTIYLYLFVIIFFSCQEENLNDNELKVIKIDKSSDIVGAEINISGTGFSEETSEINVMFGNIQGSVISSTKTNILVSVPNGSTQGLLTVTVGNQTAENKPEFTTLDFIDERDGKRYPLVYIGEQIWFGKNLNYNSPSNDACYDSEEENCDTDGRFYEWAIIQDICPTGWKVPDKSDFDELLVSVNFDENGELREGGSSNFDIVRTGSYYHIRDDVYVSSARGEFTNIWTSAIDESDNRPIIFTYPRGSTDFFLKLEREDYACIRCLME